jgi:hypothetical protein
VVKDRLVSAALFLFTAAGLWVSYHYARWVWPIDGDISAPFYVWSQIIKDGPSVLHDWRWAQDGWLFSLFLPDFLMFTLGGVAPLLVMLQGWLFFVLCILLVFVLIAPIAGRRVAAVTATTLLFAGPAAIGSMDCLTYPVTHNISILWGLAGLVCLLQWLRQSRAIWLAAGSVALFVGEVSDPWLTAALVLPIILAAAVIALLRQQHRWTGLAIVAGGVLAAVASRTRGFGLLWFLPGSDFKLGQPDDVWHHLGWVFAHLASMFNIVPLPQPDTRWMPPLGLQIVNGIVVVAALGWAAGRIWQLRREMASDRLFLALSCLAACAATVSAFVLSNIPGTLYTGRLILNWFFLLPVLVVCALYGVNRVEAPRARLAAGIWCALFVIAGIAGSPSRLMATPDDVAWKDTRDLLAFLEANDLSYGYGSYTFHQDVTAQWLTGGRIIIRPVASSQTGRIVPRIAQTFPSWYEATDIPPNQKTFFLILAPDEDLCPAPADCKEQAIRTFGPPDTTLTFKDTPIMVWNHPLLTGLPDEALIAAAPVLEPGKTFAFNRGGAGVPLMWRGWGDPEDDITWTNAHESVLLIHLPDDWTGDAVLDVEASSLPVRVGRRPQPVSVEVDGHTLATWNVIPWDRHRYQVTIPADIAARKRFPLVFHIPQASRPSDFEYIYDIRLLGMAVSGVTLHRG